MPHDTFFSKVFHSSLCERDLSVERSARSHRSNGAVFIYIGSGSAHVEAEVAEQFALGILNTVEQVRIQDREGVKDEYT